MNVVGLLLAAGSSSRFGADKRWHRLADGTPMALQAARRLVEACPHSIAVVRADDTELADLLAKEGLQCVVSTQASGGMGHSLAAGVAATVADTGSSWLVALADMPFIEPASYAAVTGALAGGARIVRPVFANRPGHPVGFAAEFRDELLALVGDEGGKSIIGRHPAALCPCPVGDPGVLRDIDHPAG